MVKHLLSGGVLLVAFFAVAPARAVSIEEPFSDPGYIPGTALSSFYWDQPGTNTGDTTGVLDIEDIGGEHGNVVKLTLNEPVGGAGFNSLAAKAIDWGGPQRANGQLWVSVDIQKGTTDGMTEIANNIWEMDFTKSNDAFLFKLQGGLGTFRLRSTGSATFTNRNPVPVDAAASAVFSLSDLNDGWNQIGVLSDLTVDPLSTDPNTFVYLNRVQVASLHVNDNGPYGIEQSANVPNRLLIRRLGRGGDENWVGSMRWDNIVTADGRPGDANHDHNIDIFDINLISTNWGSPGGPDGDANGDGNVDIFDVNLVSATWAPAPPPGGSAAVPEPATWVLLSLGLTGLLVVGRKRMVR